MSISGNWCLIISGNNINYDEIRDKIGVEPSRTVRKGEIKSRVIGASQCDIWIFEKKFKNSDEVANKLDELLLEIEPCEGYVKTLVNAYNVVIRFYIQSDFAQIGVSLPPELIQKLANLNIKMEISVFSWGGVEDSNM